MEGFKCDLLVVGAGPAGASAALEAAKAGMKVLVVERRPVVGVPVRCAEYIPAPLLGEVDLGNAYVVQSTRGMKTILPNGEVHETRAPGYAIKRDLFDQTLARAAEEAGARLLLSTRALYRDGGEVVLKGKEEGASRVQAGVIIGADGPHSAVGRWMGNANRNLIPAVQVRVPLPRPMESTEVYFDKAFYGGYAWVFPRGDEANVGLGMKVRRGRNESLGKALKGFLSRLVQEGKVASTPTGLTAGWIPSEPLKKIVDRNMLLAGDAAGQTHPITGAGVFQAVAAGKMAGRCAASAVGGARLNRLSAYEEEWGDLFGESMDRAFRRRLLLEREWDRLEEVVKRCWVSFREYYAEP